MDTTNTNTTGLMQAFDFNDNTVRVILRDDVTWFMASDVCRVLEIGNSPQAVSALEDDEKNTITINDGIRGNPNKTFISESGLYALIFKSRKPEAKKFRKWITSEVIPVIRQTGGYTQAEALPVRSELGRLRDLLMTSAEAVANKQLDVGRAQQVANLAAKYLEALKIEGDYTGYENVLGLRSGQASGRLLRGADKRPADAQMQGVLERGVPGAEASQPDLQGEAGGSEGPLAASEPGAMPGTRDQGAEEGAADFP